MGVWCPGAHVDPGTTKVRKTEESKPFLETVRFGLAGYSLIPETKENGQRGT